MNADEIQAWLVAQIAATLRLDPREIDVREPFDSFGLSSKEAVVLSGDLETLLGRDLSPTLVYEYPSIAALSRYLGHAPAAAPEVHAPAGPIDERKLIAIVGIGCRFPGADDPPAYWRLLRDGRDLIREVPPERWEVRAYYHPDASVPGKAVSRWGAFLDGVDRFDPFFFGISPGEAERMDPQQRLLLELAYECFEDAGYPMARLAGTRTGVFVGISINEYGFRQHGRHELLNGHSATGNALSIAANRISYFFDLHGPSMAVDTACSSSLMAVHLACRSLRSGECDLALAGGVNIVLSPAHSIAFTKAGVLAPDGRCKVFDARADGYVRGEGGGFVALKPLSRALADHDAIYAVIRGSAVYQDGRTNGLMAPSREAQEAVLHDAYRDAGVAPGCVQYVEAHGTGTLLGDSIEARALGAVLGKGRAGGPCALGSVKSNLGHLEAAAGIAGLVKVALSLRQRAIPPSLHFETPNPHVPFDDLGLRVQNVLTPWPEHAGPALAGVSSFGFGGTNVHVVLEEALEPEADAHAAERASTPDRVELLPLSAHSPQALVALARACRDLLAAPPSCERVSLADICASAGLRRNHLDHRVALVARSTPELIASLDDFLDGASRPNVVSGRSAGDGGARLAFVFSGQGSQWYGMGRELLHERVFRTTLEQCERALREHVDWSLFEQLAADSRQSRLGEIDVIQPTLFALQVALASLWRSWGVEPDTVVGHSMGEAAAAYVAGALTLEDAARVICERSRLLKRLTGKGGMAVVGLSVEETERALAGWEQQLSIAASNSPRSTVVSGDVAALADLMAAMERRDVFCSLVNVDVASHSPQTAALGEELRQWLQGLEPRPASLPFISTVTGSACATDLDADYWARNLTQPVSFTAAVRELVRTGHRAFIEISPHPLLQSSVQQGVMHLDERATVLPSTRRDEPERSVMLQSMGALYASGRTIDWAKLHPSPRRPVPLPTYPWQRQRFWMDAADEPHWSTGGTAPRARATHPLLGHPLELAHAPGARVWQLELEPGRAIFLRDHRVNGEIVVPASAFVEMALAAADAGGIAGTHVLADLELRRALVLPEGEPREVQVALFPENEGIRSFRLYSRTAGAASEEWTLHATAAFLPAGPEEAAPQRDPTVVTAIVHDGAETMTADEVYRALARRGLQYGPSMRGIEEVRRWNGEALARIAIPELIRHETETYLIHPVLLDAALQALAAAAAVSSGPAADGSTFVPVGCRRVRLYDRPGHTLWSHAVLRSGTSPEANEAEADIRLLDDSGRPIAELAGLRLARVALDRRPPAARELDIWLYGVRWRAAGWPATGELAPEGASRWVILADRHGLAESLRQRLEARGQSCALLAYDDAVAAAQDDDEDGRRRDGAIRSAISALLDAERSPLRGVIHLWSAEAGPAAPVSGASLRAAQALGCDAAVRLAQGLVARAGPLGMPRLWLVTRGAQPVLPGDAVLVAHAPLWGFGRTLGFELPELKCTLVDLDPALDASEASGLLYRELCASDAEDQVALRGDRRFLPRLIPLARPAACSADARAPVRADGTYLIAGGLGGLGLAVAGWLIAQGAGHLVLVGRRAPGPAAGRAVSDLRRSGAAIAVMSADVAVEAGVAVVLERIRDGMPPLRGIVHAAGVLENAAIVNLDAERLARVMAPKVQGAWNLHAATVGETLDFFVLFSSAVSVLGSPGQANYAAANSFLDALAHYRRRANLPAVSINWGPWAEIGLVANGDFLRRSDNAGGQGVKGITPHRGLEVLGQVMAGDVPQLTVLPFDMSSLLDLYPAAARIPFFAEVGGKDSHVSRLYARPNLQQDFVAPRNEIERKLAELWRQALRIDRVGVRDSFFELGGDSVLAAQIVTSAHRAFGVGIDLREAFQAFTIEHLAKRVESALIAKVEDLSESEAQRLLEQ